MQFDDTWLTDHTDFLTQTCSVEFPPAAINLWGTGATPAGIVKTFTCCVIPQRAFVDRTSGLLITTPAKIQINDPLGEITSACRVTVNGVRYQIGKTLLRNPGHSLIVAELQASPA